MSSDFIARHLSQAQAAGRSLGLYPSVILAQAALETGWGTSRLYREHNNLFGIKNFGQDIPGIYTALGHAGYPSFSASVQDYIRVMRLGYYREVLARARAGRPVSEVVDALCDSPYATDPNYGRKLMAIIRQHSLTSLDDRPTEPDDEDWRPIPGGSFRVNDEVLQVKAADASKVGFVALLAAVILIAAID